MSKYIVDTLAAWRIGHGLGIMDITNFYMRELGLFCAEGRKLKSKLIPDQLNYF
jgi:hypothetical protein